LSLDEVLDFRLLHLFHDQLLHFLLYLFVLLMYSVAVT
jgi:hypothetical protein